MTTSKRPECTNSTDPPIPNDTALFLIRDAVARRRELIYGRLNDNGGTCALGAFWDDNPGTTLKNALIEEVATVNDSLGPDASPKERWKKVNGWLRWKLRVMAAAARAKK